MIRAKLTSKGQITIPIEIRRLLNVKTGDEIFFDIKEYGIVIEKSNRPLTIQERFANYEINPSNKELQEDMREIQTGEEVGEETL